MTQPTQARATRTRAVLLATARELFTDPGYDEVSQERLVAAAGLTRGALYHHFKDKRDLFRGVLEELETELVAELEEVLGGGPDFLSATIGGLQAFLDVCQQRPAFRQIVVLDGPRVLGWSAFREIEERFSLGMLERHYERAIAEGLTLVAPVDVLARMALATCIEAGLVLGDAADPVQARADVEASLVAMFAATVGA
ncbi:TetR/AcrR family transcriptional regulator [Sporichthya polymorpha]|uniref:TetR/AcrR family transcriptional regulator n=1 Tax=Sporichthya polymorpha TaxID=35751 RepID=UPI00048DF333|nr:TetR/AcrR family transcriptional regulator [Sporichthya polymorpha]